MSTPAASATPPMPALPDTAAIKAQIAGFQQAHRELLAGDGDCHIVDAEHYEDVARASVEGAALIRKIEQYWKPGCDGAFKLHRWTTTMRKQDIDVVQRHVTAWDHALERWRTEERRRKLEEEARRTREEQQRQEALALEQAAALQDQGQPELAEAILEQAASTPTQAVVLPDQTPKTDGLGWRDDYDVTIHTPHLVPRQFCQPSLALIKARIKETGGTVQIPGVSFRKREKPRKQTAALLGEF